MSMKIEETAINILAEGSHIEGTVTLDQISRVHGSVHGEIHAKDGSTIILSETSVIEGNVRADTLMIDGYIKGDVSAKTKVIVSRTGRVIGDIKTPSLILEFGSYFEGRCTMEGSRLLTTGPELKPA